MARERTGMTPSLLGSALLHGALLGAALVSWPWLGKAERMEASVPVTLVANAPISNMRPAIQAPEDLPALTEDPAPEATPEPVAPPTPEPEPTPAPKPVAKAPAAKTPPPKPAATKPAPKKSEPKPQPKKEAPLDLDALAASLKSAGKPKSSAEKGPSRAETAAQEREAAGAAKALAASALSSLAGDLSRRWNPNCEVEGGANVDIRVAFRLNEAGRVIGGLDVSGANSADPVVKAAADRAVRAVRQAEPFENLPEALYGERITVRFNARNACATG